MEALKTQFSSAQSVPLAEMLRMDGGAHLLSHDLRYLAMRCCRERKNFAVRGLFSTDLEAPRTLAYLQFWRKFVGFIFRLAE